MPILFFISVSGFCVIHAPNHKRRPGVILLLHKAVYYGDCGLLQSERTSWLAKLQRVAFSSDAFFPFRDNIDRAAQVRHY